MYYSIIEMVPFDYVSGLGFNSSYPYRQCLYGQFNCEEHMDSSDNYGFHMI